MTVVIKTETTAMTTMREAVKRYFEENGFGEDGGYNSKWVDFKFWKIPMPFPNTAGRVKAVRFHDLHHLVTGYRTDTLGEFEISAWEIGAGCRGMVTAWVINLGGMLTGLLLSPRRIFRAFIRGQRSDTFYGRDYDALVTRELDEVRREVMSTDERPPRVTEVVKFIGAVLLALLTAAVVVPLLFNPIALLAWPVSYSMWRKSQRNTQPAC